MGGRKKDDAKAMNASDVHVASTKTNVSMVTSTSDNTISTNKGDVNLNTSMVDKSVNKTSSSTPCDGDDGKIGFYKEPFPSLLMLIVAKASSLSFLRMRVWTWCWGSGPWIIRFVPIILKKWTPNASLLKKDLNYVPTWVKLHDILIVAFTKDGLSTMATELGRLDYACALIDIRVDREIRDQMIIAIPNVKDDGEVLHTVRVEHEWDPPMCVVCEVFGHDDLTCPRRVVEVPKEQSKNINEFQQPPKRVSRDESESDVDDIYDETTQYMASGCANDASFLEDKDYNTYDTYDLDGLTEKQMAFAKAFDINLCSQIRYKSLVVVHNFEGTIAHEIGRLSRLGRLYLHRNKFSGVIPTNLSGCSNLKDLWLARNKLVGSIPKEMGLLWKLARLVIRKNKLTGGIPSFLGNITSMELFSAIGNPFGGSIPDTLGLWKILTVFPYLKISSMVVFLPKLVMSSQILSTFNHGDTNFHGCGEENDMRFIDSLNNNTKLVHLGLATFNLIGVLPTYQLQFLGLGDNQLFGSLPSSIGPIPDAIGNLSLLTKLFLYYNILEGHIPSSLRNCKNLLGLNLRNNRLTEVKDLKMLNILDLSYNNLSGTITSSLGKIPQFLGKWNSLEFLDLYFDEFVGEVPVVGAFSNASGFSVLGNNRLCGGLVTLELPKCKERGNERFLKVSYNELLKATHGFSIENLIGVGGFSYVYKGILGCDDDRFVAIKVLHLQNRGAHKSFLAECEAWWNIRHRNLLKIITSCSSVDFQGNDFKSMVYEFMSNGSVHDWLHSSATTSKLNLLQRINILKDVSFALDYLHNQCQTMVVHGDLKTRNILLDADMVAHVGDFGLARLLGANIYQKLNREYGIGSEMTSSGDVYSFGILLPEVMNGKKPTEDMFNEGLSLHKFTCMALPDHVIDVIDDDAIVLQSTKANAKKMEECLGATIKIGVSCSMDSPPQRMKIEIVVNELQRILDVNIEVWRASFNRLLTRVNLSHRGANLSSLACPFCDNDDENSLHCLVSCPLVMSASKKVWCWCNLPQPMVFPLLISFISPSEISNLIAVLVSRRSSAVSSSVPYGLFGNGEIESFMQPLIRFLV
ncbi:leucine-rich repeat protein [Tanacetum coccineum]